MNDISVYLDPVSVEFPVQISLLMNNFYQTNLVHNQTREGGVRESRLDKGEVGVPCQTLYHGDSGFWPLPGVLVLAQQEECSVETPNFFIL